MEDLQNLANEVYENENNKQEEDEERRMMIENDMDSVVLDLVSTCYRPETVNVYIPEMDMHKLELAYSGFCDAWKTLAFVMAAVQNVLEKYLVIERKPITK